VKRQVNGLRWARACERPEAIPIGRSRGAKALGVRYERTLALVWPGVCGQWFEFEDRNGPGWCQVDFIAKVGEALVVVEAKHSWLASAHVELDTLYLPVVERALGKKPIGLVVAKRLGMEMGRVRICASLEEATGMALLGHRVVWHWIGGAVAPLPRGERASPAHKPPIATHLAFA
jgi:hypothetical protein